MGLTAVQMQYTKLAYINWYSGVISTENNHEIDWWHHFVVFICKNNGFWFQAQQFCVKCSWCGHYYELNTVALNEIGFSEHIIHRSTHTHTHTYTDIFLACVHGDISNIFAKMILIPNCWNKSKNSHRILSINVKENILPNVIKRWPEMLGLLFFQSNGAELIILCSQHIQISLCKPLYLRTFKRVFVCFLFRRVIMCAFDHISYYGQCNHFLHFLFRHPHFQHSIQKCWRRALSHTEHRHENGNKENSMSNVVCFTFIPKSFHQYLFSVRCISVFVCRLALYIYIWFLLPLLSSPSYSVVVAVVIVTVWTIVCSAHWPTLTKWIPVRDTKDIRKLKIHKHFLTI